MSRPKTLDIERSRACGCGKPFKPYRDSQVVASKECAMKVRLAREMPDGKMPKDPSPDEIEKRRDYFRSRRDDAKRAGEKYIPSKEELPW